MILTISRHIYMTMMNNSSRAGSLTKDGFSALLVGVSRLYRLQVLQSLHLPSPLKMATNSYQVSALEEFPHNSTLVNSATNS